MRCASICVALAGLVLAGCPKDSHSGGNPSSPTSSAGGRSEGASLTIGANNEIASGRTYRAGDVSVTVRRISMAMGSDSKGRDVENIHVELSAERAGAKAVDLDLLGDSPGEAFGLVFKADALGFHWGSSPATAHLRVDRSVRP